mmetsp:Transcript_34714/g.109636  ORF Transcript_34714/g.109636 Transcript_34714/m.109636 type:complete len:205 (-) Transcript_34714:208-822(-)|eukprot:CAMPEP_0182897628 /NCGR_PEP_ID=MMETSP0034_2-20130328/27000_1 /TAXON_ID=156128 /ORGANISM="Nephroselmis pyriformis, Strain CCMP717" /LENGTH=204 /DNA_ID=CAMNT_0025031559 /DNA_START=144 /DNA_END=758 /DNA_ORIENTATION=-
MDVLCGLVGKDFVLLLADTSAAQSVVVMKMEEDKIFEIDSHKLIATAGESGDRVQFTEFVTANIRLYTLRNGMKLSTNAVANFTRSELATALRKSPYQVNSLIAGYDEETGPSLYFLDHLATLNKQNTGSHGYGGMFMLSLMDKWWRPNLELEEALEIIDKCILEVRSRLVVAPPNYVVKCIDKDGIRVVKNVVNMDITGGAPA